MRPCLKAVIFLGVILPMCVWDILQLKHVAIVKHVAFICKVRHRMHDFNCRRHCLLLKVKKEETKAYYTTKRTSAI